MEIQEIRLKLEENSKKMENATLTFTEVMELRKQWCSLNKLLFTKLNDLNRPPFIID